MKAAIYEKFEQPLKIQSVPDPEPDPYGVVIQVKANGISRSDWHGWMGHDSDINLPHVPGHELSGIIVEVGNEVSNWKIGDQVTVPFACGCGKCKQCNTGNQHICDNYFQPGFTAWGSFAEFVAVKYADINLVSLPEEISFVNAASLGCRFITSFRAVVYQGKVQPGDWLVVYGCGGVGLSAIMIGESIGARVIGIDINDKTLELAKSLNATMTINSAKENNIVNAVKDITGGGAHVSIDALGNNETCRNSILNLRKQGKHIQVGVMAGDHKETKIPMGYVMFNEIELIGSHGMQAHAYKQMLQMIISGKLQPQKLINQTVSLEDSLEFLQSMGDSPTPGVTVINKF